MRLHLVARRRGTPVGAVHAAVSVRGPVTVGWRRVATRYDQHAYRFLGFLYLAGAWIWLKPYLNTT